MDEGHLYRARRKSDVVMLGEKQRVTFPDNRGLPNSFQGVVAGLSKRIEGLLQSLSGSFQLRLCLGILSIAVGV